MPLPELFPGRQQVFHQQPVVGGDPFSQAVGSIGAAARGPIMDTQAAASNQSQRIRERVMKEAIEKDLAPDDGDAFFSFVGRRLGELGDFQGASLTARQAATMRAEKQAADAAARQQGFENAMDMQAAEVSAFNAETNRLNAEKPPAPTTVVNTGDEAPPFSIPSGFMLDETGKGVVPIPGGPQDRESTQEAGREAMFQTARNAMYGLDDSGEKVSESIFELAFNEDGTMNKRNVGSAQIGGVPWTKGRELGQKMELGIQAMTRSETGAAMPPSEVSNTRKRFQPSVWDSDGLARIKLEMYEDTINGTLQLINGSGVDSQFDELGFEIELQSRAQQAGLDVYVPGMVQGGYVFKGGDPEEAKNWQEL